MEGDFLRTAVIVVVISVVVLDELSLLLLKSSVGFGRVEDLLVGMQARKEQYT